MLNDTHTDRPLPQWAVTVLALITGAALMWLATHPEPMTDNPPDPPDCHYEDMLPISLEIDAFQHEEGDTRCIHIDQYNDLEKP